MLLINSAQIEEQSKVYNGGSLVEGLKRNTETQQQHHAVSSRIQTDPQLAHNDICERKPAGAPGFTVQQLNGKLKGRIHTPIIPYQLRT